MLHRRCTAALAATFTAVFFTMLTGCATPTAPGAVAESAGVTSTLGVAALLALGQAEESVRAAQAQHALWTTTEATLMQARKAAQAGDNDAVLKLTQIVAVQIKASLAQTSYPSTEPQPSP